MSTTPLTIAYFGGEPLGAPILAALIAAGYAPTLVICNPDRPVGRKQTLTPPPVKAVATAHGIPVAQPTRLRDDTALLATLTEPGAFDLFIVVAYNHLLPEQVVTAPRLKTLNVHPSLLPKLRGASPIRSAILGDQPEVVGVTIMQMDKEMDHGPIVAQQAYPIEAAAWPLAGTELDAALIDTGAKLLIKTIPAWIAGTITPTVQEHTAATYCHKLERAMGELEIDPLALPQGSRARHALLKIRAFDGFPGTFFMQAGKRIKITAAHLDPTDTLVINRVIPEGKKEQPFSVFLQSLGASS